MSNPSTKTSMYILYGALQQKKSTAAGFKNAHIGTENPCSHFRYVLINGKAWWKKICFNSMSNIRSHVDRLTIPDFIIVVSTEIPRDTTMAFMEADVLKKDILTRICDVAILSGILFSNGGGGLVKTPRYLFLTKAVPKIWHFSDYLMLLIQFFGC